MKMHVEFDDKSGFDIVLPDDKIDAIMKKYPQIWHLRATEELAELQMALSKSIRNDGKPKVIDNLMEESIDVLCTTMMLLRKYESDKNKGILKKYASDKPKKWVDQVDSGTAVFKSDKAKTTYINTPIADDPEKVYDNICESVRSDLEVNSLIIHRNQSADGYYDLHGEVEHLPEYWHVITSALREYNPDLLQELMDDAISDMHDDTVERAEGDSASSCLDEDLMKLFSGVFRDSSPKKPRKIAMIRRKDKMKKARSKKSK